MLIAIEDISGQIGHNYMRDKYVKTCEAAEVNSLDGVCFNRAKLASCFAVKVE